MSATATLVAALARIKAYLDYGTFTPIQVAAIAALEGPQDCVDEIALNYQKPPRRAVQGPARGRLDGGQPQGDDVRLGADPRGLSRRPARWSSRSGCSREAKVAVSPGIGFGEYGDGHVRFALIENEPRTRQAVRGIKEMFRRDGLAAAA